MTSLEQPLIPGVEVDHTNNQDYDEDSGEENSAPPSGFVRIETDYEDLKKLVIDIQEFFGIFPRDVASAPTAAAPTTVAPTTVAPTAGSPTTVAPTAGTPTAVAPTAAGAEMSDPNSNDGIVPAPSPAGATANAGNSGLAAARDGIISEADRNAVKKDVINIRKNLEYIKKHVNEVATSSYSERAEELLQYLMDAAKDIKAVDFHEDIKNLKHLLHIFAKLKQWIPPQRDNAAEEARKKKSKKKKKESPFVSKEDKKNAAADIVKKLVSYDCKEWEMDGLLKSYGELKVRDKLCLLCFSVFLCDAVKVGKSEVLVQKNLVIKKKILIYWWVGEGLIHPNQPSPSPTPNSTTNTVPQSAPTQDSTDQNPPRITSPNPNPAPNSNSTTNTDPHNIPTDQNTNPITNTSPIPDSSTNADAQNIPIHSPITNQIAATAEENQIPDQVWPPREDEGMTIEQIGDKILNVLRMKGFIEPVMKRGRESGSYQMLPFVHSFVTALAKKAGFFDFSKLDGTLTHRFGLSQRACLLKSQGNSPSSCSVWKRDIDNRTELKKFATVQTLFNINESIIDIKPEWFSKMKYLSVLHLGSWRSEAGEHIEVEDPKFMEELKNMKQLKLFSLQGVATIMKLPDSVCKLSNLIILDLRECHNLEELPANIGELKNLTHLDLTNCHLLTRLPIGISLLSKLEVLHWFVIYNQDGEKEAQKSCLSRAWNSTKGFVVHDLFRRDNKEVCALKDLLKLGSLRELSIVVNRNKFPSKYEVEVLMKMKELCTLKISWVYDIRENDLDEQTITRDGAAPVNPSSKCGSCFHSKKSEGEISLRRITQNTQNDLDEQTITRDGVAPVNPSSKCGSCFRSQKSQGEVSHRRITQNTRNDLDEQTITRDHVAPVNPSSKRGSCFRSKKPEGEVSHRRITQNTQHSEGVGFIKLEKLELWCFQEVESPDWLVPSKLKELKKLYIKGGNLESLRVDGDGWYVETLQLKYMKRLKSEWRTLIDMFPKMTYLEKFQCPELGLFPCDHEGVWIK